jgi:uridine kinase
LLSFRSKAKESAFAFLILEGNLLLVVIPQQSGGICILLLSVSRESAFPMPEPHQLELPQRPVVIGIAGCSGSGKTTLARELADQLDATLFPLDWYYRDLSQFPLDDRHKQNFDHPDSLESELIVEHVRRLADGHSIQRPRYDFSQHTRVPEVFDEIAPQRFVIVEGILALHWQELCAMYDFSVYVDAPHDTCLARRIHRDVRERGRTEASVREQFLATAQPMAEKFVLPSQPSATVTVSGCEALDWSVESILRELRQRKLV